MTTENFNENYYKSQLNQQNPNVTKRVDPTNVSYRMTENTDIASMKGVADMSKSIDAVDSILKRKLGNMITEQAHHDPYLNEAVHTQGIYQPYDANTPPQSNGAQYFDAFGNPVTAQQIFENNTQVQSQNKMTGVRIDKFSIFPRPQGKGYRYDVVDSQSNQLVVESLHLKESAEVIVRLLNRGKAFYGEEVRKAMELEEAYVKHYNDAIAYKRQLKESTTHDKIRETRFLDARDKALAVKRKIIEFKNILEK